MLYAIIGGGIVKDTKAKPFQAGSAEQQQPVKYQLLFNKSALGWWQVAPDKNLWKTKLQSFKGGSPLTDNCLAEFGTGSHTPCKRTEMRECRHACKYVPTYPRFGDMPLDCGSWSEDSECEVAPLRESRT